MPKANGKQRPLGIPTVVDRVIQQAIAQVLSPGYERYFSEFSYGFRPNRDCHGAIARALEYLNEGYEWVIDLDIEKYFDTVNHDKLVSILREHINDAPTLHLIRSFLKAGVMENGLASPTTEGVPQGGPLSPVLSNVYLDKLDKELEMRGLHFVRYADDCNIFVKSEMAADRVMASVTSWLERKLKLKVSATKTKVVRPTKSNFLGFTFWKDSKGWKAKPADDRKVKFMQKTREILCRKRAAARPIGVTFVKLNQLMRGWINYFGIGSMKGFLNEYGQWMRHKVRVVILKQWKKPKTVYRNLQKLNIFGNCNLNDEAIFKVANSRMGLYRRCAGDVVNYLLSPKVLGYKTKDRPGLVDPLAYYLARST
ncbi:MAG: group II intron reverse transcriptase/maturase [Clostridia bacterium]|nr:group II intron reverse transcriptase/maturase [Clostridia bacterium]